MYTIDSYHFDTVRDKDVESLIFQIIKLIH